MKTKPSVVLCACLSVASLAIAQSPLTVPNMRADLDQLASALQKYHPGLHRYTSPEEWREALGLARDATDEPLPALEFYRVVAKLLATVRCGHVASKPGGDAFRHLRSKGRQLPIRVRFIGDKTHVVEWPDAAEPVPIGSEMLAIDGEPMARLRSTMLGSINGDGMIPTGRLRELERDFVLMYGLLVDAKVSGDYALELCTPDGEVVKRSVTPRGFRPPSMARPKPLAKFELRDDGIAVFTLHTFSVAALERDGIDCRKFLSDSFGKLKDSGVGKLIVDLRGNRGGTDQFGAMLVAHLCTEKFRYFERIEVTADYQGGDGLERDDEGRLLVTRHRGLQPMRPAPNAFGGQLVVLMNGRTFSTAADVATVLHHRKRAVFIGEEAGGGYDGNTSGENHRTQLEHSQIQVRIPLWMYTTANEGHALRGRGVPPDHVIARTIDDWLAGRDVVLDKAVSVLQGS